MINTMHHNNRVSARWLGYGGALPFLICAVNLHTGWPLFDGFALQVFVIYSAVILAFLGGIRWGLALSHPAPSGGALVLSVLPALVALGCLLLATPLMQIVALAVAFAAQGALDWRYPPAGMPAWMVTLRVRITALVLLCHALAAAGVMRWS